jgi:hypothetical protein
LRTAFGVFLEKGFREIASLEIGVAARRNGHDEVQAVAELDSVHGLYVFSEEVVDFRYEGRVRFVLVRR